MPLFSYNALGKSGEEVSGQITSNDQQSALQKLIENGFLVTDITEVVEKQKQKLFSKKKVKVGDLSLFSRQLASMLGAGIPVTQAIATLSKQTENQTLRGALVQITASVEGGISLTKAFSEFPKIFPPLYISMISAGEVGGILEESLMRLSIQLQKEKQLNDNIKSATSYPKMIGGFAIFMFLAMMVLLVPIFEGFIPENADIPAVTRFTFALSHSMRDKSYIWIASVIIIVGGIFYFAKSKAGKALWEEKKLTLPLFGELILKSVFARFCRTLSTLLMGGISVVQALQSAGPTSGSTVVSRAVNDAIEQIESGKSVSKALSATKIFPPMLINMIAVGEESGTMPELLDKIAEFYEDDVATLTKNLGSIIEPIMLILIGIIVGGMLLSLYLPIFSAVVSQ